MRILVVGDVVGKPGRQAVARLVPALRREHGYELVVCNGENAAGGNGLTRAIADELRDAGCDVVTNGNHVWDQRQFVEEIKELDYCLRPLNLDAGAPGRGWLVHNGVLVANAIGRVFMAEAENPYRAMERLLDELDGDAPRVRVLDWHAEATSEKVAMGLFLDGKFSAVVGTHTHVPTADARVLANGTAFVSDIGMVGPRDSVLGLNPDEILGRFRDGLPRRFRVADGPVSFNAVEIDVDEASGRARGIARVDRLIEVA
ncbi:MAG TPA: TIGR00282 family metallophosphoesterase [Candidatus Dormibacteraeota bacterium]|nr:TIGR00282 family metallophosphoesterase [Candidatus Dormibacteraeota bacterium]